MDAIAAGAGVLSPWRPMSLTSRVFFHLGRLVNANSACILLLQGSPDPVLLRAALDVLRQRHPLLRSIMTRRDGRWGWAEQACPLVVRDIELPAGTVGERLEAVVNAAWETTFRPEADAPFCVNVFRGTEYTALQLVTSHIAEDARASYQISDDLAQIYQALERGEPVPALRVTPPSADMDDVLFGRIGLRDVARALYDGMRDLLVRDLSLPLRAAPDRDSAPRRGFLYREIDPALFERLRVLAKQRGATVHALILLALCRLIRARSGDASSTIRLVDMFSLRFAGRGALDTLYENTVIPYHLRIPPGSDDACLASISQRINALRNGGHRTEYVRYQLCLGILNATNHRPLLHALVRRAVQARVLMTNPGRIPFTLTHFGPLPVLDFFTYAQLFSPGAAMCQLSGFRDRIRLIMVYDRAALGPDGGNALADDLLAELHALTRDVTAPLAETNTQCMSQRPTPYAKDNVPVSVTEQ